MEVDIITLSSSFSLLFQILSIALFSTSKSSFNLLKASTIEFILLQNSSLVRYLYNISILASFQTRDFSTFEIDNILSLIILAI
jgi:hypothetical protein